MKNKMKFLITSSLKKKFKSKWFRIVNIVLLLAIPLLCNIDSIINYFGGDFKKETSIYVVDNVGIFDTFKENYEELYGEAKLSNYNSSLEDLKKEITDEERKDVIIEINPDEEKIFSINFITYDLIDTILYQNIINILNETKVVYSLNKYNIDEEILAKAYESIDINRVILNEEANSNSELMQLIGGVLVPIFIVPFFFLILLVIQYVGAEINEEKASKSMEIIISSVSPTIHFLSKIIATNIFVISQAILLFLYGGIGILSRTLITGTELFSSLGTDVSGMINTFVESGMLSNIVSAIPFVIILLLLSFIAYSLIAGVLASVTTNAEDYQQIQTPLMLMVVLGYYLSIMASMYDSSVFIKIASYVPLVSSILSPVLLIQGQLGMIDVIISVVLLVIFILILLKYGIKIYKTGILNYSSSKLWQKMAKAIKK